MLPLALAWAGRCRPPMDDDEMRRVVADLAVKDAGRGEPRPAGLAPWEPPLSLDAPAVPEFPTHALPEWLAGYVEAEAEATQTPADLPGMLVLAALAAACGMRFRVLVREGYSEPVNLFVAASQPPASRKSAVFADVTEPLRQFEQEACRRAQKEIALAKTQKAVDEARLDQLRKDAAKADTPDEQDRLQQAAAEVALRIEQAVIPPTPRLLASDATPENSSVCSSSRAAAWP